MKEWIIDLMMASIFVTLSILNYIKVIISGPR
jgi:hypothetical protein